MIPGSANPLLLRSAAPATYQVQRSIRLNSADSAYLSRTPGSAGNRKTWTWAGWVKRSAFGSRQVLFGTGDTSFNNANWIEFFSDDKLRIGDYITSTQYEVKTTQVFRDASAWGHLTVAVNTTQATSSNRVKVYWNGTEITAFDTATYPSLNLDTQLNTTNAHGIGRGGAYNAQYFNGYLADIHFIDGQALDPTSFGEFDATTGVWNPKAYTGTYGTNGFRLPFSDNSAATSTTLGKDAAGSNNWTPNNLSVTAGAGNDSLVDSPTNYGTDSGAGGTVRGNYCTLNPLSTSSGTYSQGNLRFEGASSWMNSNGTFAVSTGKWYYEVTVASAPFTPRNFSTEYNGFGWAVSNVQAATTTPRTQTDAVMYADSGHYKNFSGSITDGGSAISVNDVLAVAVDLDANTFTFYKNNSQIATGTIGGTAGRELTPRISSYNGSYGALDVNFGQRPFAYTAPSGYKALCTANLPAPLVTKPSTVMDVKLWTGNGSSQTITTDFSPDFVWIKQRNGTSYHTLQDIVRGATKDLYSNVTDAEGTYAQSLNAFNSNGFTLGNAGWVNGSSNTYVGWAFDAGSSTVTNTSGSISSQVRANASAGFSIITYQSGGSGATIDTVGHGLGVSPSLYIVKNRDISVGWLVAFSGFSSPTQDYLSLNTTDAKGNVGVDLWSFSSTTLGVRQSSVATAAGQNIVVYAFAPVVGYSSFGSYTGNGSSDGPFVFTGFRPRWIMVKRTDSTEQWYINDAARDTYNVTGKSLRAQSSDAEASTGGANSSTWDILSNGFKLRDSGGGTNASGGTYVFAAFAESPLSYARAR